VLLQAQYGVNTALYGQGTARTTAELFDEVRQHQQHQQQRGQLPQQHWHQPNQDSQYGARQRNGWCGCREWLRLATATAAARGTARQQQQHKQQQPVGVPLDIKVNSSPTGNRIHIHCLFRSVLAAPCCVVLCYAVLFRRLPRLRAS
jgi:hypothetical protein